ncbi:MAG: winged helix DNA-binding domain-containing protein [Candidatus Heimdallarchaeaceae archaeon]
MKEEDFQTFDIEIINHFVLNKQHLTEASKIDNILQLTLDIGGLHATSQSTPYLSLFARLRNFKKEQLDQEAYVKRNLGKIRCMRKTVFILAKETIPHIYNATKQQYSKRHIEYLKHLGVSQKEYKEKANSILEVLKGKEMSTSEIKKAIEIKENISAFINLMCDQLFLIRTKPVKSWRDKRHNYAIFREYFPDINTEEYTEEESIKFLIKYYLQCFGPVTENDITWWTGFNKTPTRKALKELGEEITKINIKGIEKEYLLLRSDEEKLKKIKGTDKREINLLPDLDPYLMGYKDRERYIKQEHYNYIFDRSGNATATIVLNGRVIGVWDFVSSKKPAIKYHLLKKISGELEENIICKAEKIAQFIFEEKVPIIKCKTMEPLKGRIPGEVMTPLKCC